MKCDVAEGIAVNAFAGVDRRPSLTNLLQAGGQLEAHWHKMCPCHGFPPVERVPVLEPVRDNLRLLKIERPITHGASAYRNQGCRCEECKDANRIKSAKYRPNSDSVKVRLDATPLIEKLTRDGRLEAIENSRISQWRKTGIDLYAADRWCVRLGYHPIEVWGQAFYLGATEESADG